MTRRRRIVVFAYACEPGKGSEPAAGWNWAQMISRLGDTWVITRANNRPSIERELTRAGRTEGLHFVYVDLPPSVRRWKRGQRGLRLYYLLWQGLALREAKRLAEQQAFDLAWHVTLANAWLGSTAAFLKIPFILGPVGGGIGTPWRLSTTLGARGILYEVVRTVARTQARYLNPLARMAWRRSDLILALNEDTRRWLPRRHRGRCEVFPNVLLNDVPTVPTETEATSVMLFAGRLLPWKGVALAIRALARLPQWHLIVCGTGPDEARLRRLARKCSVSDRVDFRGWVDRAELHRMMRTEASVFVFPSLHDDSPWAVVEALAAGLRVVCLDIGGPPRLSCEQFVVQRGGRGRTVERLAARIMEAEHSDRAPQLECARRFTVERRLAVLEGLVATATAPCNMPPNLP